MTASRTPVEALALRVRGQGSRPLLTYYDPAAGERTEFSATSFANWVAKTANLLATLGVDGPVAGPLATSHPGHWVSLIWPLACWQHGVAWAAVPPPPPAEAELVVVGPADPEPLLPHATIACSLHPFGLPLRDLPAGVLDYSTEVLAEPDAHWAAAVPPGDRAWIDPDRTVTHAEVAALPPVAGRVLVRPSEPWRTLVDAVLRPLLGGGSAVVVAGGLGQDDLDRIATAERVDEVLG